MFELCFIIRSVYTLRSDNVILSNLRTHLCLIMLHHLSYEHFEVKLWYVINTTTYVHLERFDYAPSSDLRTL